MVVECFDAVKMVVEEADRQFGVRWRINKKYYDILKQYCEFIDVLTKEHNGVAYEVEVDDIEMTISIGIECAELMVSKSINLLCELAKRTVSFGFTPSDDGNILVKFIFPSIWERSLINAK